MKVLPKRTKVLPKRKILLSKTQKYYPKGISTIPKNLNYYYYPKGNKITQKAKSLLMPLFVFYMISLGNKENIVLSAITLKMRM